jgi:hypothetical protein
VVGFVVEHQAAQALGFDGAEDARGYFASVGDEDRVEGAGVHGWTRKEERFFFFEKKKQKTFVRGVRVNPVEQYPMDKSLFASFSSEKEDSLSCFIPGPRSSPAEPTAQ